MKKHILIFFLVVIGSVSKAQEHSKEIVDEPQHKRVIHKVGVLYGSVFLPEYNEQGDKIGSALLPSFEFGLRGLVRP